MSRNLEPEIKMDLSLLFHTFYPFIPINDVYNLIDVNINLDYQKININLNDYSKYNNDMWSKTILKKELRSKKLTRILK